MSTPAKDLDKLEVALSGCMRIAKGPGYWEDFTRRAGISIDRPAATILILLSGQQCQFQTLVNRMGVEAPSVSRKVHELEDLGYIIRQRQEDKRVHELKLSNQGEAIADRLKQAKRRLLADIISDWPAKERAQFIGLLERFAEDMEHKYKPLHREIK